MRSTKARGRLLARTQELAIERATLWAVVRRNSKGEQLCSEKFVEAMYDAYRELRDGAE